MTEVDLSVLVPSYNGAERVRRFLPLIAAALASIDGIEGEIVCVDDGSSDGTGDVVKAVTPSSRVITHSRNRGASAARNSAASEARGSWLLFCDDDVELTAADLIKLWEARDPQRCLVPLVRDLSGNLQNAVTSYWHRGDLKFKQSPDPIEKVAYPMGACFLLSRDLYWCVGGFDDRYFPNGYEDAAFGAALTHVGAATLMLTGSVVRHHIRGGTTSEERERSQRAHLEKNRRHIYKNRWLFDLLVLRGWRRCTAITLGLPRTMIESCRIRSVGPLYGYFSGWRAFLVRKRNP